MDIPIVHATIPIDSESKPDDVKRLAFYLRCINEGCGLGIIQDARLLDFVPQPNTDMVQETILQIADTIFHPDLLLGKILIFDQSDLVPPERLSDFISINDVREHPPPQLNTTTIQSEFNLQGFHAEASNILVCRKEFMEDFYYGPLRRNSGRARSLAIANNETMQQMLARRVREGILDGSKLAHCVHCRGSGDVCTCPHGCEVKVISRCHVVHTGKFCDGRPCCSKNGGSNENRAELRGPRYKCKVCDDFDLCTKCYNAGEHDLNHAFECIVRVGSEPAELWPRNRNVKV